MAMFKTISEDTITIEQSTKTTSFNPVPAPRKGPSSRSLKLHLQQANPSSRNHRLELSQSFRILSQHLLRLFAFGHLDLEADLRAHLDHVVADIVGNCYDRTAHLRLDPIVDELDDILPCHSLNHDAEHARFHARSGLHGAGTVGGEHGGDDQGSHVVP